MNCPICHTQHTLYDPQKVEIYVCGKCQSVLKKTDYGFEKTTALQPPKYEQRIPLGLQGTLLGKEYTVITYAERWEVDTEYYWVEYTLRREEDQENVFLSTYNGHWMLMAPIPHEGLIKESAISHQMTVNKDGEVLEKFHNYRAKYHSASGEFHFSANLQLSIRCIEFISPPKIMALEYESPQEMDLFFGEYVYPKDVNKAFRNAAIGKRVGIGAAQPFMLSPNRFLVGALVFCILAVIIQFLDIKSRKQVPLFMDSIVIDSAAMSHPIVSKSFTLANRMSNMNVEFTSNVDNNWCEADVNMVNEQTGKEIDFYIGNSYYYGQSDGESWSEGGRSETAFICSVAPGTYHFVVTPAKEPLGKPVEMTMQITWDVQSSWNAGFLCISILVIWIIMAFCKHFYEKRRWA